MRSIPALILLGVLLVSCQATDEVKQGFALETCNGSDSDCRPGHACLAGMCRPSAIAGFDCPAMCEKIRSCGAESDECLGECEATLAGDCDASSPCPWSEEAIVSFGTCIVSDLECSDIIDGDAPQLCYQQLPLAADRSERCDELLSALDACRIEGQFRSEVFQGCYRLGRTATAESFERIEPCESAASLGNECSTLQECLENVFRL